MENEAVDFMFPLWKIYVSQYGNVRFAVGKRMFCIGKHKNADKFSF